MKKAYFIDSDNICCFDYKVRYTDLDHNHHMNNTKYLIMILDYLQDKMITKIEIDYLNSSYLNDDLIYYYKKEESNKIIVNVYNKTRDIISMKCLIEIGDVNDNY